MDLALFKHLQDSLDMKVVRCVGQSDAKLLIAGIEYSAIVLDQSNEPLKRYARKLYKNIPVVIGGSPDSIVQAIQNTLR